jgi:hypothetical protein
MTKQILSLAAALSVCVAGDVGAAPGRDPGFPVTVVSSQKVAGIEVRDIAFPVKGEESLQTSAWLVRPEKPGLYAGLFYFHLLARGSSRAQFLEEAKSLAGKGVVSVLIQGRTPWQIRFQGDKNDPALIERQIGEAGRALDVLLAEPGVDPKRVGAVGHDYGAMYLLPLLSRDDRQVKCAALLAFTPRFGDWIKYFSLALPIEEYHRLLAPVDPLTVIARPHRAEYFFQFAVTDFYISRPQAEVLEKTAAKPFTLESVDNTNHEGVAEAGAEARLAWLLPRLGVK